jgi:ribose transport system substrate-binding protein
MVALAVITGLTQCTDKATDTENTVALLILGTQTPYTPPYVSNLKKKLAEQNVELLVFDARFDPSLQASQMDEAIAQRPDAIILFALDSAGMSTGIRAAYDAGIPVIMSNNRPIEEDEAYTVCYVGPDYYKQAGIAAEMMNEILGGKGKVVMIEGAAGQEGQINRTRGFEDGLERLGSEIEIIARQPAGWSKDDAGRVMDDFLVRYGDDIDGVYAQDDTMAVGAWIAMREAGRKMGEIPIVSISGSSEGLRAIQEGAVYGTVMQSPIDETNQLVPFVLRVLREGIKPPQQIEPYFHFMDMPKVTKENVEQFLPGDW